MLQVGTSPLNRSSLITGSVVFPLAFEFVPAISVWVQRVTGDNLISAYPANVTTTGFDYELDHVPDDTDDYSLGWIAADTVLTTLPLSTLGVRATQMTLMAAIPEDNDLMAMVQMNPTPRSLVIPFSVLRQTFLSALSRAPVSPNDSLGGTSLTNQIFVSGGYLYAFNGTSFARVGLANTGWNIPDTARKRIRETVALTSGNQVQVIPFLTDKIFPNAPDVIFSISCSDATPFMITGIRTATTTANFTVTLSTAPPTGNYSITYDATSPL